MVFFCFFFWLSLFISVFIFMQTYSPQDYKDEFGLLINAMDNDPKISNNNLLIGPNLAGVWNPPDVWQTGFATDFNKNLAALAVER
jgi:hypothetical protein